MAQVQIRMAAELHVSELTAAPERGCQTAESKTCGAQDNVTTDRAAAVVVAEPKHTTNR